VSRRRKNAGVGYGMMFHGAFKDKKDAKKKERQVHGFIQPRNIRGERRFVVMSERKNPIKRKKKAVRVANPHELLVMGANPTNPGTREIVVPPGSTITIRTNPSAPVLHEEFTGRPSEWYTVEQEAHMPAGDYAQLGELLALYVKPVSGGAVQHISFRKDRPVVVSDESARQIYFVGGDQDIADSLDAFGALDRGRGLFELGEARRIDYKQRKEHVPDPEIDEWRHDFGEETDVRPVVLFDRGKKRLLLEGGEYRIQAEGIVN
jgi:hypothetical protein